MKNEFTTIQVKKEVHKRFKAISKSSDIKLRVLIDEALKVFLENQTEYKEVK